MRPVVQKYFLKGLWTLGLLVWLPVVAILLWRLPNAQSFAQASFYSTRLMYVSLFGVLWGIAAAIARAHSRKTRSIKS